MGCSGWRHPCCAPPDPTSVDDAQYDFGYPNLPSLRKYDPPRNTGCPSTVQQQSTTRPSESILLFQLPGALFGRGVGDFQTHVRSLALH